MKKKKKLRKLIKRNKIASVLCIIFIVIC